MSRHRVLDRPAFVVLLALLLVSVGCVTPGSQPQDPSSASRTIDHATGSTVVEETPERIVALEWNLAEDLLALGIQPVGIADREGYEQWVKAKPALEDNVTDVGTRQEPSLETIANLDPDLILGMEFRHAQIEDQLSDIAPTLLFDPYPDEQGPSQYVRTLDNFRTVADAVDRRHQAKQTLEALNQTFQNARTTLEAANATGEPIVLAQAFTHEGAPTLRLFTDNALALQILERIGLENAWDDGFQRYGFSTVGLEALDRVEHASFLYVAQPDDDPINETYSEDPAWQNLTFVQDDRVYPLGADVWLFGGPLSAAYTAQAAVQALTGGGSS